MPDSALDAPQLQVVDALLNGANLNAAAAQAGVHRNTIANWRHTSPAFEAALRDAQTDRADLLREGAVARAELAFQALEQILQDPKSSTSARLRAAIFILSHALPSPAKERRVTPTLPKPAQEPATQNPDFMHKNAQMPNEPAQPPQPYRRPEPKIGRNDMCPCGSGKKYKYCCLGKSSAAA
jgi:preprotein translocase subunit SecA